MSTMNLDTLAHLLLNAPKGPEDLLCDWALANRTAHEARVALQRARIKNPDADVTTLKEAIVATREAAQRARYAYMEAANITPLEATANLDAWLVREGNLQRDIATLTRQMAEA